jgi:hypothetical protein
LKTLSVSTHTYADFKDFEDFQLNEHIYAHRKTLKKYRHPVYRHQEWARIIQGIGPTRVKSMVD